MKPPKGYEWANEETCDVRCTRCDEIVKASCIDIHELRHRGDE